MIKGLNDIQKQLKNIENGSRELAKKKSVSFNELFTDSFMKKYTDFPNLEAMLKTFGYNDFTNEDFLAIPDEEINQKVSSSTKFDSWQAMIDKAAELYALDKMGFKP